MRTIVITGASSGIGAALARVYAAPGVTLGLIGRNRERLDAVAAECRSAGAEVELGRLDVRDAAALEGWIEDFDDRHAIGLMIANAGIAYTLRPGNLLEPRTAVRDVMETNFIGVIETVRPAIERMSARGSGSIAVISSISALRGIPVFPAYAASKAAVKSYFEALRGPLAAQGIRVTVVCPGFIETPMIAGMTRGGSALPVVAAARRIRRGIDAGRALVAFPLLTAVGLEALRLLPERFGDWMLQRVFGLGGRRRAQ